MTRMSFAAAIAAALVLGAALPASAQSRQAGVSAAVRGQVALARVSESIVGRQVKSGDPIFLGDAITSGKDSGLQVMLLDETVFSIGPNSEISIDEFVYDPATSAGKVTASIAKGVFRFITGKIARKRPEDMTVRLPTATIGIRGTIVAGVVRSAPGKDPVADDVFSQLSKDSPGAENALDFVILLGPGDENNTNDKGGEFVFTANPPEKARRGQNAGPALAQTPDNPTFDGNAVTVSRTGSAAVGFEDGDPQGPFFVSDFARLFSRVFPASIEGTKSSNEPNTQEANKPGNPVALSGNNLAEAGAGAAVQGALEGVRDQGGDIQDPSAGSGSNQFTFDQLRQIDTGSASLSGSGLNIGNVFLVSSFFFQLNFSNRQFQFDLNGISGGGLVSGQIACFSSCAVDYSGLPGGATFTSTLIGSQANLTRSVGCDDCFVTVGVVDASATNGAVLNVRLEHTFGNGDATTQVNLSN